jgi:hypothetical protein
MGRDPTFLSCSLEYGKTGEVQELDYSVEGTEFEMNVLKNTVACRHVAKS